MMKFCFVHLKIAQTIHSQISMPIFLKMDGISFKKMVKSSLSLLCLFSFTCNRSKLDSRIEIDPGKSIRLSDIVKGLHSV